MGLISRGSYAGSMSADYAKPAQPLVRNQNEPGVFTAISLVAGTAARSDGRRNCNRQRG